MDHMPQIALFMIIETIGSDGVNFEEMMKFVLTMKNFYRKNPYHNWEHAFNVCHCMYNILLRNMETFNDIEVISSPSRYGNNLYSFFLLQIKGLIIAALSHDVDHGGVTNNFLHISNDVMSTLYEESPWENHHYAVTMIILSV